MLKASKNMDSGFKFDLRGPVKMKGKAQPMKVYLLSRNNLLETDF